MKKHPRLALAYFLVAALGSSSIADAGELAGVEMPDQITIGEHSLVLNGMGLRKKAFIKVYVAGLYLSERSGEPGTILAADAPRRMTMSFLFSVGADKMCDAWKEGLEKNTPSASSDVEARFETLCTLLDDLGKGDTLIVTYLPGAGTAVESNGVVKGTIPGKGFADALFASWLGPEPPGEEMKRGLLGG
jgi:hypothetical protein